MYKINFNTLFSIFHALILVFVKLIISNEVLSYYFVAPPICSLYVDFNSLTYFTKETCETQLKSMHAEITYPRVIVGWNSTNQL
jgi:hypothetical protein